MQRRRKKSIPNPFVLVLVLLVICAVGFGAYHVLHGSKQATPALSASSLLPKVTPHPVPSTAKTVVPNASQQTTLSLFKKTLDVNKKLTQNNVTVTVDKVVFLQDEVTVVVAVQNQSSAEVAFHIYDTVATQARQECKWTPSNQPMLPQETAPYTSSRGVITFKGLDPHKPFTISIDVKVDQGKEKFSPYQFEVQPT